ncbi:DUF2326 domain-containing protein [Anaerocolumna sp. AGMB13025]|uniref:DUF2326 domain-containing protein n=1 Tax=Anaerocolumna sp. AGMB13025 TaxID=3039116 RepID=UPI00241C6F59|nr:DUF2326 domain-containing protein [Anaerocolumna sp. AGMB13025]WFR57707.1 DUF2326 domain-containing protein [Anaerocolumna sp. AGMB13025]
MKLLSLGANKNTFHPIQFKDGINIIVGKQVAPHDKNDGNTYNGVGKSLIIHLIHFCLGSNKIDALSVNLQGWEFTLRFKIEGIEYYTTRGTENQSKIDFNGEIVSVKELRRKLLDLILGDIELPKNMSFNTVFSRFARRYRSCYTKYDTFVPKETDYSKILNNCFLLGIDTNLIVEKKELRDKQIAAKDTEKAIKKDPMFKQYYLGKNDAEIDVAELQYRIAELEKEISEFKVSNNYHELEKEANEKSYKKKELENERVLIQNYITSIEQAFKESAEIKQEKIIKMYEAANIEIPEMVKKSVEDVLQFHSNLLAARNTRLRKELYRYKQELEDIDSQIMSIGSRMDDLLGFLDSYGALEEYTALTKQLNGLKNELARIEEYQKILKAYKDMEIDIKTKYIEQDKETELYLDSEVQHISNLRTMYWNFAKRFYPKKKSGFVIKNNSGENTLRFVVDARIEDDSSDGVNEVRMFCFDLLFLLNKISKIQFLAHDSRLFANMDPRQRETLFRIANDVCNQEGFQYICTINEDALLSFETLMQADEFKEIIQDNIRLELTDDAPESKLLGIQIDIDLEDKGKENDLM